MIEAVLDKRRRARIHQGSLELHDMDDSFLAESQQRARVSLWTPACTKAEIQSVAFVTIVALAVSLLFPIGYQGLDDFHYLSVCPKTS